MRALVLAQASQQVGGLQLEAPSLPSTSANRLVLKDFQLVVVGDLAVVLQRLLPRGLGVGAGKRNVANFQQLGSGEEGHVGRVVVERVDHAAFVNVADAKASALGVDGTCQSGGTGADHQNVEFPRVSITLFYKASDRPCGGIMRAIDIS